MSRFIKLLNVYAQSHSIQGDALATISELLSHVGVFEVNLGTMRDPATMRHLPNLMSQPLILDLSSEPLAPKDPYIETCFDHFMRLLPENTNHVPLFLLQCNTNTNFLAQQMGQTKVKLLGYNYYLYRFLIEIVASDLFSKVENTLIPTISEPRPYAYMSLNLAPRIHRVALMAHLLQGDRLKSGYVSFFTPAQMGDRKPGLPSQSDIRLYLSALFSPDELTPVLEKIESGFCLHPDFPTDQIVRTLWERGPDECDFLVPDLAKGNQFLSYFEIITDTYCGESPVDSITEKAIRGFLRWQPFIMVGPPYYLAYLRRLGFKTFHPFIDESYDQIQNPIDRLKIIFTEIDKLLMKPREELHAWYQELLPILEHNYITLKSYGPRLSQDLLMLTHTILSCMPRAA